MSCLVPLFLSAADGRESLYLPVDFYHTLFYAQVSYYLHRGAQQPQLKVKVIIPYGVFW